MADECYNFAINDYVKERMRHELLAKNQLSSEDRDQKHKTSNPTDVSSDLNSEANFDFTKVTMITIGVSVVALSLAAVKLYMSRTY